VLTSEVTELDQAFREFGSDSGGTCSRTDGDLTMSNTSYFKIRLMDREDGSFTVLLMGCGRELGTGRPIRLVTEALIEFFGTHHKVLDNGEQLD